MLDVAFICRPIRYVRIEGKWVFGRICQAPQEEERDFSHAGFVDFLRLPQTERAALDFLRRWGVVDPADLEVNRAMPEEVRDAFGKKEPRFGPAFAMKLADFWETRKALRNLLDGVLDGKTPPEKLTRTLDGIRLVVRESPDGPVTQALAPSLRLALHLHLAIAVSTGDSLLTCPACGLRFLPYPRRRRYCTKRCNDAARRRRSPRKARPLGAKLKRKRRQEPFREPYEMTSGRKRPAPVE